MKQFEFCHSRTDGVLIAAPVGEIDIATAPDLDQALTAQLANDPQAMIIRLDRVTFLDSVGISVLVKTHHRAHRRSIFFALAAPSRPVRTVLEITGIGKAIPVHATLGTALADARKTHIGP